MYLVTQALDGLVGFAWKLIQKEHLCIVIEKRLITT